MNDDLRPGQRERILHLFRRGYSLDLVSELGVLNGWSRAAAKQVLADQGWALDWAGRLQWQFRGGTMPVGETVSQADADHLLNVGIDHEDVNVRKTALMAERWMERLRSALVARERADAANAASQSLSKLLGVDMGTATPESRVRAS